MYTVGVIQDNNSVALSVDGKWAYKLLKNPEEVPPNYHTNMGFFRYHPSSDECFWIDPKIIIEKATTA